MENNNNYTINNDLLEVFLWCAVCELEVLNTRKQQSLFNSLTQYLSSLSYPITNQYIPSSKIEINEFFRMRFRNSYTAYTATLERQHSNDFHIIEQKHFFSQTGRYENDFEQLRKISSGAFGKVYEVRSRVDKQLYAVKRVKLKGLSHNDQTYNNKIMKEVNICAQLSRSKYMVQYMSAWIEYFSDYETVYSESDTKQITSGTGSDTTTGNHSSTSKYNAIYNSIPQVLYIQMELCSMTLKEALYIINSELDQLNGNPLKPIGAYIATQLFSEVLEGVKYLHDRDIKTSFIHRDLKLSNILLTLSGDKHFIKLCDFGLTTISINQVIRSNVSDGDGGSGSGSDGNNGADDHQTDHNDERMTTGVGTPEYIADEVYSGLYTNKADMFSVGVIMSKLFSFDYKQLFRDNIEDLSTKLIDDNADHFLRYSRKLLSIMRNLCDRFDANRRPLSDTLLFEKEEWIIKFDDIKCDDSIRQICYESTKLDVNELLAPLTNIIILKKFEWHLDSYHSQKKSWQFTDHYKEIKGAKMSKNVLKNSNIDCEHLRTTIYTRIIHALHIFGTYGDISHYIKSSMENEIPKRKWKCYARMNYRNPFNDNEIRYNNLYYSCQFIDVYRLDASLLIDVTTTYK